MRTFENDAILLVGCEKGIYNWQHAINELSYGNMLLTNLATATLRASNILTLWYLNQGLTTPNT
jgi:hypothetical protein